MLHQSLRGPRIKYDFGGGDQDDSIWAQKVFGLS